jgi:hypothetical protein
MLYLLDPYGTLFRLTGGGQINEHNNLEKSALESETTTWFLSVGSQMSGDAASYPMRKGV